MKRSSLIKELKKEGCFLLRFGKRHDIYYNPKTNEKQPVPRHNEIDDVLVKHIKKYLGLK
jgi:predicted RNA binding protein YcfA (HicA-like mRNA interferase family)